MLISTSDSSTISGINTSVAMVMGGGAIEASFRHDLVIKEAVKVLEDESKYDKILE